MDDWIDKLDSSLPCIESSLEAPDDPDPLPDDSEVSGPPPEGEAAAAGGGQRPAPAVPVLARRCAIERMARGLPGKHGPALAGDPRGLPDQREGMGEDPRDPSCDGGRLHRRDGALRGELRGGLITLRPLPGLRVFCETGRLAQ